MAKFNLPELPWATDALAPSISQETIEFHYNKHQKTYVDKLNAAIDGNDDRDLETIVKNSEGAIFNNAAQIWNHNFFWQCLTPNATTCNEQLMEQISICFGSFDSFKKLFIEKGLANFGSGWTWLVCSGDLKQLEIINTDDADNPLTKDGLTPLLGCDVWEHAYYIDYRNNRAKYLENFFNVVNWDFVSENFAR